jgi:hypothetical protein
MKTDSLKHGDTFKYRSNRTKTTVVLRLDRSKLKENRNLTQLQQTHVAGDINLYAPVEAYEEQWEHIEDKEGNFLSASPLPGTKKRNDLPPVSVQWQQDFKARFRNG